MEFLRETKLRELNLNEAQKEAYVAACAAAGGAAVLDTKMPGWHLKFRSRSIDFSSSKGDILALLYGSFNEGLRQLSYDFRDDDSEVLGFASNSRMSNDALTYAWRHQIDARRARQ